MEKKQIPIADGLFYQPTSPSEKPYLIGSKCRNCGYVAFPKKAVCPVCVIDDSMKEIHLSGLGTIDSFAVTHVPSPGFTPPYVQAYVNLAEGPSVFSLITGCAPSDESLHIGMEVEVVLEKISEDDKGNDLIGYKFRPVGG